MKPLYNLYIGEGGEESWINRQKGSDAIPYQQESYCSSPVFTETGGLTYRSNLRDLSSKPNIPK